MDDDRELVKKCLGGDKRAFGHLVERHQKSLYNAAARLVGDPDDAADVTQEAFLKAYQHLPQYRPSHKFFSWIYRIVINESLNHLKRGRRMTSLFDGEGEDVAAAGDGTARDASDTVERALGGLSPEERAIVLLKHLEGFSYEEIGYIFEIPQKTVKSRLYSARQHLKVILLQQGVVHQNA